MSLRTTESGLKIPDFRERLEVTLEEQGENLDIIERVIARYGSTYKLIFDTLEQSAGYQKVFFDDFETASVTEKSAGVAHSPSSKAYFTTIADTYAEFSIVSNHVRVMNSFSLLYDGGATSTDLYAEYSLDGGTWTTASSGENSGLPDFTSLACENLLRYNRS
jgi:hypothetical protein